ncbi:MAG: hypothetical protein M0Z46_05080 [Actinomycetota bacterium]|nr:hypothetical protein [Actinomycetota bacterium]
MTLPCRGGFTVDSWPTRSPSCTPPAARTPPFSASGSPTPSPRLTGPGPEIAVEAIADPDEAARRDFHGSLPLLVDGIDPFSGSDPKSPATFACHTYRTEAGIEGAPSVDQIADVLAS